MASRCGTLMKRKIFVGKVNKLRCLHINTRPHNASERCGCNLKSQVHEKDKTMMISRNARSIGILRPSLLYAQRKEIAQNRTFFSNPFDSVLKDKRKEYSERKVLGFSMDHMYDVVANVDDYKYFVPWCRDSKILETKPGHLKAYLEVGFPPLIERYTSILTLVRPNLVKSECVDGDMFNYMKAIWRFSRGIPGNPNSCTLNFHIAFEFKSALHSHLSTMFFDEVVKKMVQAFENRCEVLHGSSLPSKVRRRRRITSQREAAETS